MTLPDGVRVKPVRPGRSVLPTGCRAVVTARGHMRFMIKEKGSVNADVFIEFLKRLIAGAERTIFLIVDRGPAHRAKKTQTFVWAANCGCFFCLPSPDRNPEHD